MMPINLPIRNAMGREQSSRMIMCTLSTQYTHSIVLTGYSLFSRTSYVLST